MLNNQADVFDPGDTLPASLLQQVQTQAKDRYQAVPTNSSYYFWFGVTQKPFNNLYARQAVIAALDPAPCPVLTAASCSRTAT